MRAIWTELPAIVGRPQEHVETESARLYDERQSLLQELLEQEIK